ncbi:MULTISPECIES: DUF4377 domain-containing protein [unclassified Chryseobacterium]|uniref:DUF4377 domain-containing protein n=1 Tax=unclassified Chryseobacterium TaxID=2593645 RepID=UPI00226AB5EB|nr:MULTISPECIES: DUF4377 domain-containing protein [unclassified Chryseobacterium]
MKSKTLILTGFLALSSLAVSAQKKAKAPKAKANVKTFIIGPQKNPCMSINQQGDCYQLKTSKTQKNWENFSQPIKGFKYTPGYEYEIQVRADKPKESLEGATEEYTFVKTVSKKKAKS